MSTRRLSRCCEKYGDASSTQDSSDPSTSDLPATRNFRHSGGSWRRSDDDRSRSGSSSREFRTVVRDSKNFDTLRLVLTKETSRIQQLQEKRSANITTRGAGDGEARTRVNGLKPDGEGAKAVRAVMTFLRFIGPGFMIAVAYVDPGNFATDIAAGASYRFKLLFVVLVSNLFAVFLQGLAIKFGTVTGMDLATAFRLYLPRWLNYCLYGLAEVAIVATDIAGVVGTAIGLNLLIPKLPLVAGCLLSILEVVFILIFYRPDGSMRSLRSFEIFVCLMLVTVVICFCIQLSLVEDTDVGEIFRGYLPSEAIFQTQGLYCSCGILGATIMPHGLFLGSGMVQPRLREFDAKQGLLPPDPPSPISETSEKRIYVPSHAAIKHSFKYSIAELAVSLIVVALFINSAILVISGTSLFENANAHELNIFGMHDLLSTSISPVAGRIFALALLLSALSAGIVCTIAGQMISEGALGCKMKPWLRRLVTRSISVIPATLIAAFLGRRGLSAALTGSQVALSTVLPFVTLPLIYFTSRDRYMTVQPGSPRLRMGSSSGLLMRSDTEGLAGIESEGEGIKMANSWPLAILAGVVWLIITVMIVANLILMGVER
ncbi:Fc.00g038970.m01.CDS01 [Cosmosporella sp. VM-42]